VNLLDLTSDKARAFLLKEESYINFDLPPYFVFSKLLKTLSATIEGKPLSGFYVSDRELRPCKREGVNYKILSNKDGKYAWRPFQLIHPALYVSLVHEITETSNWALIRNRFKELKSPNIECFSLPVVSESKKTDRAEQVLHWWEEVEQQSISLGLEYDYVFHTDIVDCYGAIYTHSIAWALHGKEVAKKKQRTEIIGNIIDRHIRDMSYGQTNGIPQGSVLMDFVAEIVLLYIDHLLSEKLDCIAGEFQIIRYRDDYRIFVNSPQVGDLIIKELTEVLSGLGMKLNPHKTQQSNHPTHSAIKPDKFFWFSNKRESENLLEFLYIISSLAEKYPNSGTVSILMKTLYTQLDKTTKGKQKKITDPVVLVSVVTDIALRNPRVYPFASAIISQLLSKVGDNNSKEALLHKVFRKFAKIPNTGTLQIWLQRIALPFEATFEYTETLCKRVGSDEVQIWDSVWLNDKLQKLITETLIIDRKKIGKLSPVIPLAEVDLFKTEYY